MIQVATQAELQIVLNNQEPPVVHTMTYRGNDEEETRAQWIPYPSDVMEGTDAVLSSAIPVRSGYRFIGWNTDPVGIGTAYQPGDVMDAVKGDIELHAQWEKLPDRQFWVRYSGNERGCSPVAGLPNPEIVLEGDGLNLSWRLPVRSGYRFIGWNTRPDGGGTAYQPGSLLQDVRINVTLYAIWAAADCCDRGCCCCTQR